jgi:L,D-peptidoglycan transpeptidase YkuD (ErfK/YbiS/YcfS/YnhG family)
VDITRRRALSGSLAGLGAALLPGCSSLTMMSNGKDVIDVSAPAGSTAGTLRFGDLAFACMLGHSGILNPKHEGDGGTPAGLFALREVRYRPDHLATPPKTGLLVFPTLESDGWCDDPSDPNYNRIVHLPYQTDCEKMWRDDHAYDVLAVIGYNDAPPVPGAGSAIFLHVARPDGDTGRLKATAGCVSMPIDNVLAVLAACSLTTMIRIRTT